MMDMLFKKHLSAAFELGDVSFKQKDWASMVEILYDADEIEDAVDEILEAGGFAAIDYETNCIKPEWTNARIYSCSISNGKRTIAFPWIPATREITGKFLFDDRVHKISSNLKMEERWTQKEFGQGVRYWGWDTMLAAHALDNRTGVCSLKFQAFVRMGILPWNEHIEPFLHSGKSHFNRIQEISTRSLLLYNGLDALFEYELCMIQRKDFGYDA